MQRLVQEEGQDRQPHDAQALDQQPDVGDQPGRVELHETSLPLRRRPNLLAVEQDEQRHVSRHNDRRDRGQVGNERPERQLLTALPIMMLGGSPISVAVPPTLEAMTCVIRNGIGERPSRLVMLKVTGTISRIVVTLSRKAEAIAVISASATRMRTGSPFARFAVHAAANAKTPGRDRDDDHHADQEAQRVEIDVLQRRLLIHDAERDNEQSADHRHDRPVDLLRNHKRVSGQKDSDGPNGLLFHNAP